MPVTPDEFSKKLVAGMLLNHGHNRYSFWHRLYDHAEDIPAQVPKIADNASKKEKECHHNMLTISIKYENLSLRKELGANQGAYIECLLQGKVAAKHGK